MEKQTSFAHQKRVLEQFLSIVSDFENNFKELMQRYEQDIYSLYENEGLMQEIYDDYKSLYFDTMRNSLSDILSRIPEEDIPYIEKEIDFISSR